MERLLEKIVNAGIDFGLKILVSLIILAIGIKLIDILEKYLKKDHKFSKLDPSVKTFVVSFVVIALKVLLFVTLLTVIGIPMTSLITILGSCALAIGLALQGGLSNLAGGLMILIFKPFKVGDYIEVNTKEGKVKAITLFYTTAVSPDNKIVQLPNGSLSNSNITNYTANKTRMIEMNVTVKYDSDIEKVKKVLLEAINETDLILKDEPILIRMKDYTDSSLNFVVRVWTKTIDYTTATFDLKENIKLTVDKNKI
jgi:small conductance mechanosensitive channel